MTLTETSEILAIIKTAFPNFYKDYEGQGLQTVNSLWHDALKPYSYAAVSAGVSMVIMTHSFPPVVADVIKAINSLTQPKELTPEEAWEKVKKAISNSTYGSVEEFEKLPQEVQAIVGSPNSLRALGQENEVYLTGTYATNFKKEYAERINQKRIMNALPEEIQKIIDTGENRLQALSE